MCPLSDRFARKKLALWFFDWGSPVPRVLHLDAREKASQACTPKSRVRGRASATSQAPGMNLVATTLRTSLDVIKQHDHSPGGGPSGGRGTRGHRHLSQRHLTLL